MKLLGRRKYSAEPNDPCGARGHFNYANLFFAKCFSLANSQKFDSRINNRLYGSSVVLPIITTGMMRYVAEKYDSTHVSGKH